MCPHSHYSSDTVNTNMNFQGPIHESNQFHGNNMGQYWAGQAPCHWQGQPDLTQRTQVLAYMVNDNTVPVMSKSVSGSMDLCQDQKHASVGRRSSIEPPICPTTCHTLIGETRTSTPFPSMDDHSGEEPLSEVGDTYQAWAELKNPFDHESVSTTLSTRLGGRIKSCCDLRALSRAY